MISFVNIDFLSNFKIGDLISLNVPISANYSIHVIWFLFIAVLLLLIFITFFTKKRSAETAFSESTRFEQDNPYKDDDFTKVNLIAFPYRDWPEYVFISNYDSNSQVPELKNIFLWPSHDMPSRSSDRLHFVGGALRPGFIYPVSGLLENTDRRIRIPVDGLIHFALDCAKVTGPRGVIYSKNEQLFHRTGNPYDFVEIKKNPE